jgi:hypothetical protein
MAKHPRPSLDAFVHPDPVPAAPAAKAAAPQTSTRAPSLTVYLPPKTIRRLKEIGLEENRRLTDILAEAVDQWLVKNGHPSLDQLSE